MATAPSIISRIREWSTSNDTAILSDTEILAIMNGVAREAVENNDIWFCLGDGSTTFNATVTGNEQNRAVTFPTRLVRPVYFYSLSGSDRTYHTYFFYDEFKDRYLKPAQETVSDTSGPHWTVFGTIMLIGPNPTAGTVYWVNGYYYEPDLNLTDNSTNNFTTYAEEFLLFGTLEALVKFKFEEEVRLGLFTREKKAGLNRIQAMGDNMDNLARRAKSKRKG